MLFRSAYEYQRQIETGKRIVVGVNAFQTDDGQKIPVHSVNPKLESAQVERLQRLRASRNASAVAGSLERLEGAARTTENLMPYILQAVENYATVGEISNVFRKVHGEYREESAF